MQGAEFVDVLQGRGPTGVWIAVPGADAAARGVEEDAVEFGFGGERGAAIPYAGSIIEEAGAPGAALKLFEAPFSTVAGPDEAFVVHEVAEVESFAAFARAGVPPGLAGNGLADKADGLGVDVLEFESAGVEFFGAEEVLIAKVLEDVGDDGGRDAGGGIGYLGCVSYIMMGLMGRMGLMIEIGG